MKAKDLTIGMECYHHTRTNWLQSAEIGTRVVIVDPLPGYWYRDPKTAELVRNDSVGQDVLVDRYLSEDKINDPRGDRVAPVRMAVSLGTLRGPWQQTYDHHMHEIEVAQRAYAAAQALRKDQTVRCERAVELLAELGIKAATTPYATTPSIVITEQATAALAAAAQQLLGIGWRADNPGQAS